MAERSQGKPDKGKRYYRIGEVSKITGVKPYVLRYWESEFRWMTPQKSRSKQRLYRRKDIEMILLIRRLLHEERYTIAGARKRLRDLGIGRALSAADTTNDNHKASAAAAGQSQKTNAPASSARDAGETASELDPQSFCRQIRSELQAIRDTL